MEVVGFNIKNSALIKKSIYTVENLLPPSTKKAYSYIEPSETDMESASIPIPNKYDLLSVEIYVLYNKHHKIGRSFFIPCKPSITFVNSKPEGD